MAGDIQTPDHCRRQFCAGLGASFVTLAAPGFALAKHTVRVDQFRAAPAKAFELNYDGFLINRLGTNRIASASLNFQPNADRYKIVLAVDSFLADLHYQSEGRIDEFGLRPEVYRERRKVPFRRRKTKMVRYQISKDPASFNQVRDGSLIVPPNTQDRLSLLVHFAMLAQKNPQLLDPGHDLAIPFARTNRVDDSRWQIGELEQAPSVNSSEDDDFEDSQVKPFVRQSLQAQRIERVRPPDSKKLGVAFWLTNDVARLPLVLQFSEKGRVLKFVWRS